ncbi:hypothetical protein LDENG_00254060, partial [Lucifuga dentata]
HACGLSDNDKFQWTAEAEKSFNDLKLALQSSPTLGLPDNSKPFLQTVDDKNGLMSSVVLQDHGGKLRPVAYFSTKFDPVAAGLPHCPHAIAAAEKTIVAARDLVAYSPLTLLVPRAVAPLLMEQKSSHFTATRWLKYHSSETL